VADHGVDRLFVSTAG